MLIINVVDLAPPCLHILPPYHTDSYCNTVLNYLYKTPSLFAFAPEFFIITCYSTRYYDTSFPLPILRVFPRAATLTPIGLHADRGLDCPLLAAAVALRPPAGFHGQVGVLRDVVVLMAVVLVFLPEP